MHSEELGKNIISALKRGYTRKEGEEMKLTWEDLPQGPVNCLVRLEEAGFAAYPVGGCVRDLLLGREPGG